VSHSNENQGISKCRPTDRNYWFKCGCIQ